MSETSRQQVYGSSVRIHPEECLTMSTLRAERGRTELLARGLRGTEVMLVRGEEPEAVDEIEAEADLLEQLSAQGATIFPRVLGRDRTRYVREAPPVRVRRAAGRRAGSPAAVGAPAERRAAAEIREVLDADISLLHAQGWSLGAAGADVLSMREDGSVMVHDLSGLRPGAGPEQRLVDQRWIDAVLGEDGPPVLARRADPLEDVPPLPPSGASRTSADPAVTTPAVPVVPSARPAPPGAGDGPAASAALPRAVRGRRRPRGRRHRTGRSGAIAAVVISASAAALAGGGVLLVSAIACPSGTCSQGPGSTPVAAQPSAAGTSAATSFATASTSVARPADPAALVEEIIAKRRTHLLEGGEDGATAAGSPAAQQDASIAKAYREVTVSGWETSVREARLTAFDAEAGTATVHARVRESARTITGADGSRTRVPATSARTVVLELRMQDGGWRLVSAEPA